MEAWCLQYNQHLGKTLLLPVEEPKSILDQVITETILRKLPEIHDRYIKFFNLLVFGSTVVFGFQRCSISCSESEIFFPFLKQT